MVQPLICNYFDSLQPFKVIFKVKAITVFLLGLAKLSRS